MPKITTNVLAFAATNHQESINKKLLHYAVQTLRAQAPHNLEITYLDLINYELPLYRQDREQSEGIPAGAQQFYDKIGEADALMISFAEHNGTFTAVYKNLFDWMSRIDQKVYQDKPMVVMAASPGPRGGAGVLAAFEGGAPFFGVDLRGKISLAEFQKHYDPQTETVVDATINQQLQSAVAALL